MCVLVVIQFDKGIQMILKTLFETLTAVSSVLENNALQTRLERPCISQTIDLWTKQENVIFFTCICSAQRTVQGAFSSANFLNVECALILASSVFVQAQGSANFIKC